MILWLAAAWAAEIPQDWSTASTWVQTGLVVTAVGAAGDAVAGPWALVNLLTDDAIAPRLQDGLSLGSGTVVALGVGTTSIGGLLAARVLRREGVDCPVWAGWTALGIEALALGLLWVDPIRVASGRDPLPAAYLRGWTKIVGLPFAVIQLDTARRRSQGTSVGERPLIGMGVTPSPAGAWIAGRF